MSLTPPHQRDVATVFATFLKLGVTSFGGPIAHLGYFREECVTRKRWITERQFAELLALCQFLPGPTSSQLGFAIGLSRAGYLGAIAAWLAFTAPSALLLMLFAVGTGFFEGAVGSGVLTGLHAVAVAVVAHAVWGMARTLTPDFTRVLIAIAAAALALMVPGSFGQLAAILCGVAAGALFCRTQAARELPTAPLAARVSGRVAWACLILLLALLTVLPVLAALTHSQVIRFADAFVRAGALVFGGGHVMLPLLQAEPAIAESVSPEQFLAGYGAAQAVPGPLFTFAAYLGQVAHPGGGVVSALVALVAVFLPGMLLLLGILPFWSRLRTARGATAALGGANAAVVGLLAAALYRPLITTGITDVVTLGIALVCAAILWCKAPAWVAVAVGASAGAIAGLLR